LSAGIDLHQPTVRIFMNCQRAEIDSLKITHWENDFHIDLLVTAKVTFEPGDDRCMFRYFLGKSPDVSYRNYKTTDIKVTSSSNMRHHVYIDTTLYPSALCCT